jgi:hypothetical protein
MIHCWRIPATSDKRFVVAVAVQDDEVVLGRRGDWA